jgi:hypothetical protein
VCGKAGGLTELVVLQGVNVVQVSYGGWDASAWPKLPNNATVLARHVLERLDTLR